MEKRISGSELLNCSEAEAEELKKFVAILESGADENGISFNLAKDSEIVENMNIKDEIPDDAKVWVDLCGSSDPLPKIMMEKPDRIVMEMNWWGGKGEVDDMDGMIASLKKVIEMISSRNGLIIVLISDCGPSIVYDPEKCQMDIIHGSFERFGKERYAVWDFDEEGWIDSSPDEFIISMLGADY